MLFKVAQLCLSQAAWETKASHILPVALLFRLRQIEESRTALCLHLTQEGKQVVDKMMCSGGSLPAPQLNHKQGDQYITLCG